MQLFKKTKALELKMNEFLDTTCETGMVFLEGVKHYLRGDIPALERQIQTIRKKEQRGDQLRREIEAQLYTETLIPESRGDVLALLENTDDLSNKAKSNLIELNIQTPKIPEEFHKDILDLAKYSNHAIDEVIKAVRAFFQNPIAVRDYLHKVYHFEKEADRLGERLKTKIFKSDLMLSEKSHLRYFVQHFDDLANKAEDVADRLAIYTIKRSI
ncbi:MAG: DUF47 family protein [Candidatus Neomarinimicrobiota bacterium]